MTTFTTNDREEAYKKILEEAPAHVGYEDAVDPVACGVTINVEPITFVGTNKGTKEMNQQLQDILQVIFTRLKALEDSIAELQKIQDDLLSR